MQVTEYVWALWGQGSLALCLCVFCPISPPFLEENCGPKFAHLVQRLTSHHSCFACSICSPEGLGKTSLHLLLQTSHRKKVWNFVFFFFWDIFLVSHFPPQHTHTLKFLGFGASFVSPFSVVTVKYPPYYLHLPLSLGCLSLLFLLLHFFLHCPLFP